MYGKWIYERFITSDIFINSSKYETWFKINHIHYLLCLKDMLLNCNYNCNLIVIFTVVITAFTK